MLRSGIPLAVTRMEGNTTSKNRSSLSWRKTASCTVATNVQVAQCLRIDQHTLEQRLRTFSITMMACASV